MRAFLCVVFVLLGGSLAAAPTSGFLFTNRCSSTETEREERMIVVGNAVTLIIHDETLWRQAQTLIGKECELGLLEAR